MPGTGGGLEVRGLEKSYGTLRALDGLDFAVAPGEVFGFVGANGAGKSTTMKIALGVLSADAGEVLWDGRPIDARVRRRVGYMPEERGLYPKMHIAEQLVYLARLHGIGEPEAKRSVAAWLERLGLAERAGDDLTKLSHGNQQRVQLAAALVVDPVLLVLDEPFAGLDPEAVDAMSGILRERAAAGIPVIFSSHQLELVERISDRVGIIRRGRMVALGTVDELRGEGPPRLWVDAPAAAPGWERAVPGATRVRAEGSRVLLELAPGTDDQAVLRAALATGPVAEFGRDRPALLDLFREVVTDEARAGAAP